MKKLNCILLRFPAGIDDDETTNFINQMLLEDVAVTDQVLVACNGREALGLIKRQCAAGCCPELILLDVNMPVMNGFEFLATVATEAYQALEMAHKRSTVIVMLTTSLNPLDLERVEQVPVAGFLNKPLT